MPHHLIQERGCRQSEKGSADASCILATMHVPARIPGLRAANLLLLAAFLVWIALEGDLVQLLALSLALTLLLLAHSARRWPGGRTLSPVRWLAALSLYGLVAGLGSGLVALLLMAVKTGLHDHGPEFTASEIGWVAGNLPVWAAAGLLGGAGLGLLALALQRR
jgi:hypothetical protein